MKIIIPDDYQDAVRGLACFSKLTGQGVTLFNDTVKDLDALVERFQEADSYELYFGQAFDQVVAFAAGKPINVVNPEALR